MAKVAARLREGRPYIGDLFAGNYMFLQVAPSPTMAGLDDKAFETGRDDLEKSARELATKVGPTDVVRHYLERTVAEVLSNPRLAASIEMRLKKKKD